MCTTVKRRLLWGLAFSADKQEDDDAGNDDDYQHLFWTEKHGRHYKLVSC